MLWQGESAKHGISSGVSIAIANQNKTAKWISLIRVLLGMLDAKRETNNLRNQESWIFCEEYCGRKIQEKCFATKKNSSTSINVVASTMRWIYIRSRWFFFIYSDRMFALVSCWYQFSSNRIFVRKWIGFFSLSRKFHPHHKMSILSKTEDVFCFLTLIKISTSACWTAFAVEQRQQIKQEIV